jgi:hypothetical protein
VAQNFFPSIVTSGIGLDALPPTATGDGGGVVVADDDMLRAIQNSQQVLHPFRRLANREITQVPHLVLVSRFDLRVPVLDRLLIHLRE